MTRENAQTKGRRYLAEGRLIVTVANEHAASAICRGGGALYQLGFGPSVRSPAAAPTRWAHSDRARGGWACTCPGPVMMPFRSPRTAARQVFHLEQVTLGQRGDGTATDDQLAAALAGLEEARSIERAVRTLVAERKEGASALSTAEYRLHCALNRVEALGGMKPPEPVAESDDDYGPDAA